MSTSIVLAGSNSKLFSQKYAQNKNYNLLNHRIVHFVNSEMKVTLPPSIEEGDRLILIQSTSNPANDSLVEILLLADTLKREGVEEIQAIIPYFGYARQDKQHLPKECVSIETIAKILETVGMQKVITADIHNELVLDKLNLDIQNISVLPTMAAQVYQDLDLDIESEKDITIASPDDGGIQRAKLFAKYFYKDQKNTDFVSIKKTRHLDKVHYCEAVELRGEIKDKKVILIDDISTSGSTILNALELCKANNVNQVYVVIVHADFAKGVAEKFENSDLVQVYTSNTIENTVEKLDFFSKIKVLDVSTAF